MLHNILERMGHGWAGDGPQPTLAWLQEKENSIRAQTEAYGEGSGRWDRRDASIVFPIPNGSWGESDVSGGQNLSCNQVAGAARIRHSDTYNSPGP